MSKNPRDEETAPEIGETEATVESELDETAPVDAVSDETAGEATSARDSLSIALVAGIAALLLICVLLIFVANGHRPAGL